MYFQWTDKALQTQRCEIPHAGLLIGRDPESELCLAQNGVSRHHACIEVRANRCQVTDLGSTNGTYHNSVLLPPRTPTTLSPADTVTIGESALMFCADAASLPDAAGEREAFLRDGGRTQVLPSASVGGAQVLLIGRDPACDVILDGPGVSWRHARMTRETPGPVW